ncbi:GNS1/SUR4 family [Popillia japonica]|uniref:Elongation of very long chain fatty acids protein n=1 Tax=Popillia japonica TaxID=7064 RepID=A0AAW1LX99_POPJA
MALAIKALLNFHDYALDNWRDARVDDWPLMSSCWSVVAIVAVYLYIVFNLGPKFMENRKPFELKWVLIGYNIFQVLYCLVILVLVCIYVIPHHNVICAAVDTSTPHGLIAAKLAWAYFLSKIIDLLDTVFFVLRKKDNQITFLHVYHHAGMVVLTWIGCRFIPGGSSLNLGILNTFVHAFMYSYYLASVWDKKYARNLWLKKQITHLQMIQFALVAISYSLVLIGEDCGYPKFICIFIIPQNLFMFYMFGDFYFKSYIRPLKAAANSKKED